MMSDGYDRGAHFFRCDFQVHTPRDRAWKGKPCASPEDRRAYARSLVEASRNRNLNAIAITDHHDLCFYPYVKEAAAQETDANGQDLPPGQKLVVFPAVELTLNVPCQAILILDSNFPETLLPQVLTALTTTPAPDFEPKAAEVERIKSITTLEDLKQRLDEHDFLRDRYIVLPNVTSGGNSTLLRDGVAHKYKTMPCVGGYLDGPMAKCKPGDTRITNGEDKNYGNKRIALFQTSDSRSEDHADLGRYSTWVKWAAPTAEALRQACLAQDSRIAQEAPQLPSVVIRSLHVSNSEFLGPIDLYLSSQYTALIGSRGTGKSTILEYLRWGLCDEHESHEDDADRESVGIRQQRLIDNTLKKYEATVEVRFEVNGVSHLVRRRSATAEILLRIGDAELQPCTKEDIRTLLPIQAYSQKQLSRVGQRVDELNRFVRSGIRTELDTIDAQIRSLASQSRQLYSHVRRKQAVERALREDRLSIQSLSKQAQSIRESLTGLSPDQQQLLSRQPTYLEGELLVGRWDGEIRDLRTAVTNLSQRLASLPSKPKAPLEDHPEMAVLSKLQQTLQARVAALSELARKMNDVLSEVVDAEGRFKGDYATARAEWTRVKAVFDESYGAAKNAAWSHQTQLKALADLEQKVKTISERITGAESEVATLGEPETAFRSLREQWRQLHHQRGELYAQQCTRLTELSDGIIRATALRGANVSAVDGQMRSIMKGSGLRAARIEELLRTISESTDPIALWDGILDELETLAHYTPSPDRPTTRPESPALVRAGFGEGDLAKLAEKLAPETWLELALTSLDEEMTFQYRTKEQEYIPFENASAGQQATALLITLLNQVGPPLVIDQPEDDLDNQIVFDIVKRVWRAKTRRQLIFSSHNANLVVNGDAELVVWCDYRVAGDHSRGRIANEGAVDIPEVRNTIKAVMEGGDKAFKLRLEKYGF
jgi:chromosome segregation protein